MLPDGTRMELGAVADFIVQPSDREIQRLNRLTTVVINANLAKGTTLDEARKRVEPIMKDYPLPAGYAWKFGRGLEENDAAIQTMAQNMVLAVVLIFLVMASLFESALYRFPSYVDPVRDRGRHLVPCAHGHLDPMMAMIGFAILIGVVVNIGIVLIAHVIEHCARQVCRGKEAILQAGRDRLRPILHDGATTLLGCCRSRSATPGGWRREARLYYPMARTMGGFAFSAVVSLLIVPMLRLVRRPQHLAQARVLEAQCRTCPRRSCGSRTCHRLLREAVRPVARDLTRADSRRVDACGLTCRGSRPGASSNARWRVRDTRAQRRKLLYSPAAAAQPDGPMTSSAPRCRYRATGAPDVGVPSVDWLPYRTARIMMRRSRISGRGECGLAVLRPRGRR
jgi:hypothetical protein